MKRGYCFYDYNACTVYVLCVCFKILYENVQQWIFIEFIEVFWNSAGDICNIFDSLEKFWGTEVTYNCFIKHWFDLEL